MIFPEDYNRAPIDPNRALMPVPVQMPPSCGCDGSRMPGEDTDRPVDRDVIRLRALMATGMDQWAASHLIWPPPVVEALPAPTGPAITPKRRRRFQLPVPKPALEVS